MDQENHPHPPRDDRGRWTKWKWPLVAVGILVALPILIALLAPYVVRIHPGPSREYARTINNMRQIGMSLLEFEVEYGSLPNDLTLAEVRDRHPESRIPLGISSSNDYFHQLFAAGIANCPSAFYGYGISTHRLIDLDENLPLPPGTCGIAYIIRDAEVNPPNTPILAFPMVRGRLDFEKKLCKLGGGMAYIMFADFSVRSLPVDSSGRVIIGGRDMFDPDHPHWHGRSFRVAWPD